MINLIKYPILSRRKEIVHFSTTRTGGVSSGNYDSLNLGIYSGDKDENISENFSRLCDFLNIDRKSLFLPYQTHSDQILIIDKSFISSGVWEQEQLLYGKDALITNEKNILIGVTTADCVPLLLFDIENKVVAGIHAGWRGTFAKIVSKTIEKMQSEYHSNLSDILAVIGPSISPAVYEVGEELFDLFKNEGFDIKIIFTRSDGKLFLDLWKANENLLLEKGVRKENIEISGHCTFSENDKFFSARRLGIKSGRIISVIGLR